LNVEFAVRKVESYKTVEKVIGIVRPESRVWNIKRSETIWLNGERY
jgi:hypothetical protein